MNNTDRYDSFDVDMPDEGWDWTTGDDPPPPSPLFLAIGMLAVPVIGILLCFGVIALAQALK